MQVTALVKAFLRGTAFKQGHHDPIARMDLSKMGRLQRTQNCFLMAQWLWIGQ